MTKDEKLTKLIVRIDSPPVIIFRLDGSGTHRRVDVTSKYESAFNDSAHYYWLLPTGKYQVAQRNRVDNCTIDANGKITWGLDKPDKKKDKKI